MSSSIRALSATASFLVWAGVSGIGPGEIVDADGALERDAMVLRRETRRRNNDIHMMVWEKPLFDLGSNPDRAQVESFRSRLAFLTQISPLTTSTRRLVESVGPGADYVCVMPIQGEGLSG